MKKIKFIISSALMMGASYIALAQETKEAATEAVSKPGFQLNTQEALLIVAVLLLIPIFYSSRTFLKSIDNFDYKPKDKIKSSSKSLLTMILLFSTTSLFAETKEPAQWMSSNTFSIVILFVILLEVIILVYLNFITSKFIGIDKEESEIATEASLYTKFINYWKKVNNFIPIEQEANLDTGHSYDGIRELDNVTPPWFKAAFVASIIFAFIYLYRYHVAYSAPNQIEEYTIEMKDAEEEKAKFLAMEGNKVDENSVTLLSGGDLDAGKALFIQKCAACHGENGASKTGGVGPNLVDKFWIHGGSLKNVFVSIKNGWPEKGMIAWKEQLSPKQIAQVASFVKSIENTVSSGGKEPQGEPIQTTTSAATDTTSIKIDSTDKK